MKKLLLVAFLGSLVSVAQAEEEFVSAGNAAQGAAHYKMYCALCHGAAGKGDGPGAAALTPKPRDLSDKAFVDSLSDHHIFTIIKEGGPAVGKSMFMTPWKAVLNDDAIHDVIAYVRSLASE